MSPGGSFSCRLTERSEPPEGNRSRLVRALHLDQTSPMSSRTLSSSRRLLVDRLLVGLAGGTDMCNFTDNDEDTCQTVPKP